MSSRSYLVASNLETIYPSQAQADFDVGDQLIASDVNAIPLLWLAAFREGDLRTRVLDTEGGPVSVFGPLTSKKLAIEQLKSGVHYLAKVFPELGPIDEYAAMLSEAIEAVPYAYVSLQFDEIAGLFPKQHRFDEIVRLALRGFEHPDGIQFKCDDVTVDFSQFSIELEGIQEAGDSAEPMDDFDFDAMEEVVDEPLVIPGLRAESHVDVLKILTSLRPPLLLPSARMYVDHLEYSAEQQWNFTRMLGAGRYGSMGYGREVPWEVEDADYGWRFIPDEDSGD